MKKDRVVALCICVLLLANFQLQQIAGTWQLSMPCLPKTIWAVTAGWPFGIAAFPWASGKKLQSPGPSGFLARFAHAGWPQLAFAYDEIVFLQRGIEKRGHTWAAKFHRNGNPEINLDADKH